MPFIVKIKETEQYRLFGSIPILCDALGLKIKNQLRYNFSEKKEIKFENDDYLIVKVPLERGGSAK